MILKTFIEPPIENNNYLIIDEQSKDAALVDCSAYDDNIELVLEEYGAKLKYILLTHGHFDHIAGIRNNTNVKIYMNKNDLSLLNDVNRYLPMFGVPDITIPNIDHFVEDGEIIVLGDLEIKVMTTPGHTQGGVCYLLNNILFSGDTLFRESVGRCDLEGGDVIQIEESIRNKLFTLPEDIVVYPGHGRSTTIGWEKLHNKAL